MAKLELFPEQQKVIDAVAAAFRNGHKRVMVSAACGFGKTELATAMLQATHDNGRRGGFLCDRIALVNQTADRFDKYGLPYGVIQADHPRWAPSQRIQVISVHTVARRMWPEHMNLIVVDEAHVLTEAVKKKLEAKDCYAIGLSATAITRGLGRYFDVVVNAPPTNRLIESGRLVPLKIHSWDQPNMEGCALNSKGEYTGEKAEKRILQVVGDVVEKYLQDGADRKFICFAWSIAHAQELQRQFLAAGINCATYTANDQPEDRHEVVQEFKKPDSSIRGLLTVAALTRGFDQADVDLLIDARPLRKAVHEYVQMLGRVMRSFPGKECATVFDHSGNATAFWSDWNELFEFGVTELDDGKPKPKKTAQEGKPEPVKCPECRALHKPAPFCPACGHAYPRKAAVQHVPGTLKELVATGDQGLMRKTLWPQVCWYVKHKRSPRDDIHAQKMAQAIYAEITGSIAHARFENTKPEECSSEVLSKIRGNQQRWVIAKRTVQAKKAQGVPA